MVSQMVVETVDKMIVRRGGGSGERIKGRKLERGLAKVLV